MTGRMLRLYQCVNFKHGRKLVGDRMAKSRLSNVNVIESQFADDTATNASSRETFEQSPMELLHTVKDWGMTVRIEKTKGMVVGANLDD